MALGEPQAEDTQHHSRDIVALASLGQAWTLPVELGGTETPPPDCSRCLCQEHVIPVLLSLHQPLGMLCGARSTSYPRSTYNARAAAFAVKVGAPLPKRAGGGHTESGLCQKAAPLGVHSPAQPHLLLAMPVTLGKVVSFCTDLGPCHSPKSKSP